MFKIKHKKCPNTFCPPKKEHFCPLEKIELNTGSAYCRGHGVSEKFVSGPLGFNPLRTDVSPNDTKNHDILNKYNPLNDHHLKGWLSLATTRKLLYSQGLITSDGRVICNTKDYNVYKRNAQRRDNYIKEQQRERDDKQKQEQLQVFAANQNNRKELARKLKVLKAAVLADKLRNKPIKEIKYRKIKKTKPLKKKKIETYTVYGLDKNGKIDRNKYQGTFIKGHPDNYNLCDLFDKYFKNI